MSPEAEPETRPWVQVYLGDDLGKHKAGSEDNETEQRKATKRSPAIGSRGSVLQGPLRSMQNVPEMSTETPVGGSLQGS